MINIALCEDDAFYTDRIEAVIKNNFGADTAKFDSGEKLLDALSKNNQFANIFIMDIELPGISGFDTACKIKQANKDAVIIFITNYDDYVFDAYEIDAFRYIQKKNMDEKLPKAVSDAVKKINGKKSHNIIIGSQKKGQMVRVDINDIVSFEKVIRNIDIKLSNGEVISDPRTISDLMDDLNDGRFMFAKRGVVINVNHVVGFKAETVILDNDTYQHVSRNNIKLIKKKLMENWEMN